MELGDAVMERMERRLAGWKKKIIGLRVVDYPYKEYVI